MLGLAVWPVLQLVALLYPFLSAKPAKQDMSGILSWLSSLLSSLLASLGLSEKKGSILLLGLDNAGKTTLLHRLRTGTVQHFPPTDRPNRETFAVEGGVTFQAW